MMVDDQQPLGQSMAGSASNKRNVRAPVPAAVEVNKSNAFIWDSKQCARTEGWIAGYQCAKIRFRNHSLVFLFTMARKQQTKIKNNKTKTQKTKGFHFRLFPLPNIIILLTLVENQKRQKKIKKKQKKIQKMQKNKPRLANKKITFIFPAFFNFFFIACLVFTKITQFFFVFFFKI